MVTLETLEEIADDPEAYASKKGLGSLDLSEVDEMESLKRLWNALQAEIIAVMEAIEALREVPNTNWPSLRKRTKTSSIM